ncbi:MAG: hypothetical protein II700_09650 [Firmicutes bacterium]|nr:hypothetical protein [Bacillota bacterium]
MSSCSPAALRRIRTRTAMPQGIMARRAAGMLSGLPPAERPVMYTVMVRR